MLSLRKREKSASVATLEYAVDRWQPSSEAPPAIPVQSAGLLLTEAGRARCAAPGCNVQQAFWRKTARPVFEQQWFCSVACARDAVRMSVQKSGLGFGIGSTEATQHRHRIPLGLLLLEQGVVSPEQLRAALDAQRRAGEGRIGRWLHDLFGIGSDEVTRAVATQWNRPVLSGCDVSEAMASVMPRMLRHRTGMLPLRLAGGKILYTAFAGAVDHAAVSALERMCGLHVESGLLSDDAFERAAQSLECMDAPAAFEQRFLDSRSLTDGVLEALFRDQPVASRLVSLGGCWWLRMWLEPAAIGALGTMPASSHDVVDVVFCP